MPFSYARYSAAVKAHLGVTILSTTGSLAKFKNMTTLSKTPLFLKLCLKYSATSYLTPIAAKTTAKFSFSPSVILACRTICTASLLCGRPLPEKTGSFCPRIRVVRPSIEDMPVCIKFLGYCRITGLMGSPFTSLLFSGNSSPSPSTGLPIPSSTLPNSSIERGIFRGLPRSLECVFSSETPLVPSNICTTHISPSIFIILPSFLFLPIVISTISS